ncbi:hypothetical protein BDQ12DRAFT_722509 [Crucibulum laeve]|uniref:DUF6534 domain-containing protein n=1 Tax=Crucibulum laeve TaxID=68775 RepID=A0A5C3M5K2_9AGAR|nr:hypothetical protein BDQ12DRAFT_722509 [Crucibulum laeve]
MFIIDFGYTERLDRNPNSLNIAMLMGGMVDHLVKAIFIYRLYKFSGTLYIPIPLGLFSVFLFSIIVLSTIEALEAVTFRPLSPELEWLLSVVFIGSAVQDLMVAGSLCYYIQKARKEALKNTTLLLDRLFIYTIQTGLATSLAAVSTAVSFFTMNHNNVWEMLVILMHSLFSNALLSTLNARTKLVSMQQHAINITEDMIAIDDMVFAPGKVPNEIGSSYTERDPMELQRVVVGHNSEAND